MITHIFHISDIHILDKNYVNIRNSWKQLVANIITWPNYKNTVLLVITGDIFEFKTYLNSDDVHVFYELMMLLEINQIQTIIIPGNHDYNINVKCAQDNISILLGDSSNRPQWQYIKCFSKTGAYLIDNICFYVHSPIDKAIPQWNKNAPKNTIHVALLHEPIISAKYDNNEAIFNGRFKQEQLAQYDMVMLGDIHRPQFLAPNMAYAGSFVQKNRGEGLNHGYILWDIATRTGQHVWIPLKEIALKIVAKDNNFAAPLPDINAKITYLALIYQNCSADWLKSASIIIRDKYQQPISQIIRHDPTQKMKINITNTLQMDPTKFSHENLIVQKLQQSKTDDAMIQRVLDYHNKFLQNRQIYPTVRYHIRYLSWSNVFCYGPDNHINFEDLNGLVALCGRNKIGKSSVIDIIIRILFNECERGHKDDIINKHAKSAFIKCCFRIHNDEYIIEQSWQRYSSATIFHLYRNGEDISKDTIVKTYKYMREELGLGSYKDFVNLTTAMQNRQFIIDLEKKDIYSLLCKLLDIDTMRDIEDHVKKERDFLRRDKKAKLKELDALGTESNREEFWAKEIKKIEEHVAQETKYKAEYEDQLHATHEQICELNRQIQIVDLPADWEPHDISTGPNMPFTAAQHGEHLAELQQIRLEFGINKDKLQQYDKSKIRQIKEAADKHQWKELLAYFKIEDYNNLAGATDEKSEKLKSQTGTKLWIIEDFKTPYSYDELIQFPECKEDIDNLYRKLVPCKQKKILPANKPLVALNVLQKQLDDYHDAQSNLAIYKTRRTISYEIFKGATEFEISPALHSYLENTYDQYRHEYTVAKHASKINIDEVNAAIAEWQQYNEVAANNEVIRQNAIIEEKIKEYNLAMDIKHDLIQHQHTKENNKLKQAQYIWQQYCDCIYLMEYTKLRTISNGLKEQADTVKAKIAEYEEADRNRQEFTNYDANLAKYKQRVLNEQFDAKIAELKIAEQNIATKIQNIDIKLASLMHNIDGIKRLAIRHEEIKNAIVGIDDTLNLYETYYGCINYKTGIPSSVLRQVCVVLSERCNQILDLITDFNVEFTFEEEIRIFTIAKSSNIKLSASLGSGFQKFLLDMIMRIVLTRISNISNPNILFVDEGFGCLDKENFASVCSCLIKMKSNFDAMIVITHIPELQAYMNQIMNVNSENGQSHLQFGHLTIDDLDLYENANLRAIKQSIEAKSKAEVETKPKPKPKKTLDKNPEIIMDSASATPPPTTTNDTFWPNQPQLCELLNTDEAGLAEAIFQRMIPLADEKYTCAACQKSFKKIEQAKAHIATKTYKSKHYKYLTNPNEVPAAM